MEKFHHTDCLYWEKYTSMSYIQEQGNRVDSNVTSLWLSDGFHVYLFSLSRFGLGFVLELSFLIVNSSPVGGRI